MSDLTERLISWAQNEEMIDRHFTDHGRDCIEAIREIERLEKRHDNFLKEFYATNAENAELQARVDELEGVVGLARGCARCGPYVETLEGK